MMKIKALMDALNNGIKMGCIKEDQDVLVFNYESSLDDLKEISYDKFGNLFLYIGEEKSDGSK